MEFPPDGSVQFPIRRSHWLLRYTSELGKDVVDAGDIDNPAIGGLVVNFLEAELLCRRVMAMGPESKTDDPLSVNPPWILDTQTALSKRNLALLHKRLQ